MQVLLIRVLASFPYACLPCLARGTSCLKKAELPLIFHPGGVRRFTGVIKKNLPDVEKEEEDREALGFGCRHFHANLRELTFFN